MSRCPLLVERFSLSDLTLWQVNIRLLLLLSVLLSSSSSSLLLLLVLLLLQRYCFTYTGLCVYVRQICKAFKKKFQQGVYRKSLFFSPRSQETTSCTWSFPPLLVTGGNETFNTWRVLSMRFEVGGYLGKAPAGE